MKKEERVYETLKQIGPIIAPAQMRQFVTQNMLRLLEGRFHGQKNYRVKKSQKDRGAKSGRYFQLRASIHCRVCAEVLEKCIQLRGRRERVVFQPSNSN